MLWMPRATQVQGLSQEVQDYSQHGIIQGKKWRRMSAEESPSDSGHPSRILNVSVTKKVPNVPNAVLSHGAQRGYQFPDSELIVMRGTVADHPVRILFDTGSTHNVISSRLVKKLRLPTVPSDYSYTVELADGKGTETWDQRVVGLPFSIQSYEDRLDFEITRLARFDLVLSKQWHAQKKPTIDFSSHVYQFEHEGRRLKININQKRSFRGKEKKRKLNQRARKKEIFIFIFIFIFKGLP